MAARDGPRKQANYVGQSVGTVFAGPFKSPEFRRFRLDYGDPYGTRTRVSAVRGPRPRPLDEGATPEGIAHHRW